MCYSVSNIFETTGIKQLFIVDNSIAGTSGLQFLRDLSHTARALDVATGYFDIGSFLVLGRHWQSLEKIRVLMGDEATERTMKSLAALGDKLENAVNSSLDKEKKDAPYLRRVTQVLEAIKSGKIEMRVYEKGKFHAKTFISQEKEISRSLVGSSNFTKPGLSTNVELNVVIRRNDEIELLKQWFEKHWNESKPVEEAVLKLIDKHIRHYSPFEIYAKSLQSLFESYEPSAMPHWEQNCSTMFPKLDVYQQEAYWALMKIAEIHKGAFLCDGVGLGKTFVGLMLIESLVVQERKNVALFAPRTTKENVWIPLLQEHLPDLGGTSGIADLSNLAVYSHTDFSRHSKGFPGVFDLIEKNVDVVIVDEAHHFRNLGSRYKGLYKLLDTTKRPKTLYMFTATPICNCLDDFRHMLELTTRKKRSYFHNTLGIEDIFQHLRETEKRFFTRYKRETEAEKMKDAQGILASDKLISKLVVQRSRKYVRESQKRAYGKATTIFPEHKMPIVANYSLKDTYGELLDEFKRAFQKKNPLFSLPIYSPLRWYIGEKKIDSRQARSQTQVIGLIRTMFLKRFESSIDAFEVSCITLLEKILAFVEVHEPLISKQGVLEQWKMEQSELLEYIERKRKAFGKVEIYEDDEQIPDPELTDRMEKEKLKVDEYDLRKMLKFAWEDIKQLSSFIKKTQGTNEEQDDKAQTLLQLINSDELKGQKVLIFTEFAHTAKYLYKLLQDHNVQGVMQFDGSSKVDRKKIVKRFSPFYNKETPESLSAKGEKEVRILISTDVLSEGLNLQDATKLINYDIHWSPVRLMQRIGRVDRRMDPQIEKKIRQSCPTEVVENRGKVKYWNFLPPAELEDILKLYEKVTHKTLLISKFFGIEGKKLLTEEDDFEALKEFNEAYEGSAHTELEDMHIEYQKLLQADLGLEARLKDFPLSVFSGRKAEKGNRAGLFFCYRLPVSVDGEAGREFTQKGDTSWYLYDSETSSITEDPIKIVDKIRSTHETKRVSRLAQKDLIKIRGKVEEHIKRTYLQQINAPDSLHPELVCWLEIAA